MRFRITSVLQDSSLRRLLVAAIAFTLTLSNVGTVHAQSRVYSLDVVELTWPGAPAPAVTKQEVAASILGGVRDAWRLATEFDGMPKDSRFELSLGRVLKDSIPLVRKLSCDGGNFQSFVNEIREAAYKKLEISNVENRAVVILVPYAGCLWTGRATLGRVDNFGGGMVLQDTASSFVIAHEIGHLLGLGHSNLLRCSNGKPDGDWSSTCKAVEYGGAVDLMSNVENLDTLSIYHQWRLGLIKVDQIRTSWKNETIELREVASSSGLKGIFIKDGSATYWLEYRLNRVMTGYESGLVVYRTDPPPHQYIESPLSEGAVFGEPGIGITADMWMLNLGTYSYSPTGKATGSMTLSPNRTFTTFSGDVQISISPTLDSKTVKVVINRKPDVNAPPTPKIIPQAKWLSRESEILEAGYEDKESSIARFEARLNGQEVIQIAPSDKYTVATYLDPFNERKILRVNDLPEGEFSLSIRSIDVWGNSSEWSTPEQTTVDRSGPVFGTGLEIVSFSKGKTRFALRDFRDLGVGLCATKLFNNRGFALGASFESQSPAFNLEQLETLEANFESFDCLGNGITGNIKLTSTFKELGGSRRTGKWIETKVDNQDGLKCVGRCTVSVTARDQVAIVFGGGGADLLLSSKPIAKIPSVIEERLRIGANLAIGDRSKVLRISGRDFTIYGLIQSKLNVTQSEMASRQRPQIDYSLSDPEQKILSGFGFNQDDFSNIWSIQPMERGTTLMDPTLDLCGFNYQSEQNRQTRRQLIATSRNSPYIFLSSEVVRYRNKDAATFALSEVKSAYSRCRESGGAVENGVLVEYKFLPLNDTNTSLVDTSKRVLVHAQIGSGGLTRHLLGFYQFHEEMFTGLYIVKSGETGFEVNEIKDWLFTASVFANRLLYSKTL